MTGFSQPPDPDDDAATNAGRAAQLMTFDPTERPADQSGAADDGRAGDAFDGDDDIASGHVDELPG